ncbi:MAG TPA: SxtJ family membrane protein [Syntrophorhabdaceae bacterium]|nr:SxtJ family membrane protein [Syntrophorhabdaceae bacterium]
MDRFKVLQTISTLAFVALVIGLIIKVKIFLYIALAFLFVGLFIQRLAEIIAKGWLKFANFLGIINTKIILTVVFYGFLTPIAFFYRKTHGDFMHLKRNPHKKSFYEVREYEFTAKDLEKLW